METESLVEELGTLVEMRYSVVLGKLMDMDEALVELGILVDIGFLVEKSELVKVVVILVLVVVVVIVVVAIAGSIVGVEVVVVVEPVVVVVVVLVVAVVVVILVVVVLVSDGKVKNKVTGGTVVCPIDISSAFASSIFSSAILIISKISLVLSSFSSM